MEYFSLTDEFLHEFSVDKRTKSGTGGTTSKEKKTATSKLERGKVCLHI
jgi:hypothetical protein